MRLGIQESSWRKYLGRVEGRARESMESLQTTMQVWYLWRREEGKWMGKMHNSRNISAKPMTKSRGKVTSFRRFESHRNGTALMLLLSYALAGSSSGKHDLCTTALVDAGGQQQMLLVSYVPRSRRPRQCISMFARIYITQWSDVSKWPTHSAIQSFMDKTFT